MRGTLHGPSQFGDISRFIPAGAGNTERFQRRSVGPSVYPRWRGEHIGGQILPRQSDGLSPLARGTPNIIQGINNYRRFIPAGSGNTQRSQTPEMEIPVYPRWRGEHPCSVELKPGLIGLSPLARGTLGGQRLRAAQNRFIPAGAGNTRYSPGLSD